MNTSPLTYDLGGCVPQMIRFPTNGSSNKPVLLFFSTAKRELRKYETGYFSIG